MNNFLSTRILGDFLVTGEIKSTLKTGNSPFIVESTTLVDNLNVEYLNGQLGSYYLDWTNFTNKPDPVITLGGDLTGSVTLTDLGSGTLTATIAADSVALGTDTTGNYVATISSIVNGGITINNSGAEAAAVTLGHSNIITAGSFGDDGNTRTLAFGGTFIVPDVTYDVNGHLTTSSDKTLTLPSETQLSKVDGTGDYISDITVSGHQITEVKSTWPTFNQDTTGTSAKTDALKTIATATDASFYLTFVDSNNGTAAYESYYTDPGISYNPSTNTLSVTNLIVSQTTTTNQVEVINTSNGIVFEGATNDEFETTLKAIDTTTSDKTVWLPDASGTIALTSQLHTRSHAMTSTSDHTAGNWKLFYSNASGQVIELALGADNTVLKGEGATSAPTFGQIAYSEISGTPTIPTVNDGTLTLAVAGVGLSGSATFTANDASSPTFTVTSNATDANTASTIVARDANGDFSAGDVSTTTVNIETWTIQKDATTDALQFVF